MLLLIAPLAITQSRTETAAHGVIERLIPKVAKNVTFTEIPATNGKDTFEYIAKDGKLEVKGSSSVAMCRGTYDYLKKYAHASVSWSGDNLEKVTDLPSAPKTHIESPVQYRHYFNVCTFGYTTVWWDWKRWQHEIDWMAMHGINMPLAMNGQEAVWQKLFQSYGVPDSEIRTFLGGPAFLPWHRMGNVDAHMGPLPQSWIDGQADLQKQILKRERELGMTPVVPGFSGFVPKGFDKQLPGVKLDSPEAWAGFSPTYFIDVRDPHFVEVGKKFVEIYRKEFGSDHLYLCDTFNEQNPKYPESTKLKDLAQAGNAVYESMKQADPDAIWVMQGWLFHNAPSYWHEPEVAAMLSKVPDDRMIILDLASNESEVWREHPSVRDKGYIYNTLHNYGQNTALYGNLKIFSDKAIHTLNDPTKGRLLGMGLTPEGIDQNPVIYELMTDLMWSTSDFELKKWLQDSYVPSRYGTATSREAWADILTQIYSGGDTNFGWRDRPGASALPRLNLPELQNDIRSLIASAKANPTNELIRRDLVDVEKTWLGALAQVQIVVAQNADPRDPAYTKAKNQFFELLKDIDTLQGTRPEHTLSKWVTDARKWGKTPAEKDLMEQNAKMQITVWGGPVLDDYANKEWSGIIRNYFIPRWQQYFTAKEAGNETPDLTEWENKWAMTVGTPADPKGDSIKVSETLIDKYFGLPTSAYMLLGLDTDGGIAVGKPVTDSGHNEPGHPSSVITDGDILGNYWSASPAPQWVQIDLQSSQSIDRITLFPYIDGRYYQYKAEASEDGTTWRTIVDGANNTTPATIRGYDHKFPSTKARYIRVTMLKNSANIGVHLYEVRVFGG